MTNELAEAILYIRIEGCTNGLGSHGASTCALLIVRCLENKYYISDHLEHLQYYRSTKLFVHVQTVATWLHFSPPTLPGQRAHGLEPRLGISSLGIHVLVYSLRVVCVVNWGRAIVAMNFRHKSISVLLSVTTWHLTTPNQCMCLHLNSLCTQHPPISQAILCQNYMLNWSTVSAVLFTLRLCATVQSSNEKTALRLHDLGQG